MMASSTCMLNGYFLRVTKMANLRDPQKLPAIRWHQYYSKCSHDLLLVVYMETHIHANYGEDQKWRMGGD